MPSPSLSALDVIERAVRRAVEGAAAPRVLVALSGGPDSLALAVGAAALRARGVAAGAVVVDHGMQDGSAAVAAAAAATARSLGLDPVPVIRVTVDPADGGPEAAARTARYAALADAARAEGATVLLGHTRDDQSETVLLGLARGSGARSMAGMPEWFSRDGVAFLRPLLRVTRAQTEAACAAAGLHPWRDPHNEDAAYARSRLRGVMPLLEDALGPGIGAALARSADLLRTDADALDALAATARAAVDRSASGEGVTLSVAGLVALLPAVRSRVLRSAAIDAGAPPGSLTAAHVASVDRLVTGPRGHGPVTLPGPVRVERGYGRLRLAADATSAPR